MARVLKLLAVVLAVLMVMSFLFACDSGQRRDAITEFLSREEDDGKTLEDKLLLAWSPSNLSEDFFKEATRGFEDYCAVNKYIALIANPKNSAEEQYSEFENWLAMDVDAIAAAPVDSERLSGIVSAAKEKGIIVAGFFRKIPAADFNYTLDEYDLGYLMGQNALKWIDEKLGGKASALLILNDTDEQLKARGDGIKDALKQNGNVRIIDSRSADSVPDAKTAANDMLSGYPNINCVICINDDYAAGVLEIAEELEIDNAALYIGGAGYTKDALVKMNEEGSWFRSTVNLSAYENGRLLATMMAEAAVNGVKDEALYFEPSSYWQNILGWN